LIDHVYDKGNAKSFQKKERILTGGGHSCYPYFPRLAIACVKDLAPMAEKMPVILALESWLSV
jgi:hypothetical protein